MSSAAVSVKDLSVAFTQAGQPDLAVDRISFDINRARRLRWWAKAGSGKSISALSILKLLPYPAASHPSA
jgi:microcin C transport system ATP-binding protein